MVAVSSPILRFIARAADLLAWLGEWPARAPDAPFLVPHGLVGSPIAGRGGNHGICWNCFSRTLTAPTRCAAAR